MTTPEPDFDASRRVGTERALRVLRRATTPGTRRFAKRALHRWRSRPGGAEAGGPLLTVVIPVYNVETYLRQCLDSALDQSLRRLEVIAVDDGSTDSSPAILAEYAARDPRVRVFAQTNSGQGIARNLAVTHARGAYLTFLDADDTVPPRAYAYMLDALEHTGSDFCLGSARRIMNGRFSRTPWQRAVHESDRLATTLEDFPAAMQDVIACNRMFRTRFWVDRVGEFRGHIAYEDHVPMLTAYVRARTFDVLSGVTYNWRQREDRTSTSQQKASLENLLDRIAVKQEAHELLKAEASDVVYDAWVARALEVDFPPFIAYALAADDMYRNVLSAAYRTFFDRTRPAALEQMSFFQRVRGWLVAQSRWADLEQASEYFRLFGRVPPMHVEGGRVHPSVPAEWSFLDGAPEEVVTLSAMETRFDAALEGVRWAGDHELELTGFAMVAGLDTTGQPPHTTAWLVDETSGSKVDLPVTPERTLGASRWAKHGNAGYDAAGFRICVDTDLLRVAETERATDWSLRVRVDQHGIVREGRVHNRVPGSSATVLVARPAGTAVGPGLVAPTLDSAHGFVVRVEPLAIVTEGLDLDGHQLSGTLRPSRSGPVPTRLRAHSQLTNEHVNGRVVPSGVGRFRFEVRLPARGPARAWVLDAVDESGARTRLAWPQDVADPAGERGVGKVAVAPGDRGQLVVHTDSPLLTVDRVAMDAEAIELEVLHEGLAAAALETARLGTRSLALPLLDATEGGSGRATLRFGKRTARLNGPVLPAPSGDYILSVGDRGATWEATPSPGLAATLPVDLAGADLDLSAVIALAGELRIRVGPPLAPTEVGTTAQRRMQREFRTAAYQPRDSVLFQCYRGEFATDSQRALDDGLRAARPGLTRYWGVADLATELPEGAVPVVMGSREWYDVLGSSTYLCNNIDFDGFFVKRPHQRYLQTFHGYPFKSMGASFWSGKGWGPDRIAAELARRNAEWDQILVPSEVCAQFYRDEYGYAGEILVTGYPRCDFLVDPDVTAVRARVLGRLGVPTDKTVVLYAPTYRDDLTTRVYAAKIFDGLDLTALTAALGGDYVVLLRGHNNNQREPARVQDVARVVDVTDYPEVNDLTVAADVAVLDYSSLRFDWAITGKPMVFFVPDLEDYFATRPPLFDFDATAPGPFVRTTAEVADRLRDLAGLRSAYDEEIARFNAEFNLLHDGHATDRVIAAFFDPA